ncbi:MAG TPA: ribonuclease PH [Candidatus Avacidaminococcus intestinavium]|uniref:Ribonuclease PH n=1 Tax=Candidatus Avacidaminococcus intestinavium TaxID=2840684 RepID=A0A9D1SKX2_9FIRM|nr:ribonuclease PH [Candidatus Avacidaminococcus intestinavium]
MQRSDKRTADELRQVTMIKDYIIYPEGSVLIKMGNTVVLCNATVEEKVPRFLHGTGKGWVTAEYSLLPRSTAERNQREATKGKQTGRTQEIQRLIGRSLRSVVDLTALGEQSIIIDCDVLQADGGTRTASITASFVALALALDKILPENETEKFPLKDFLSAISVGIVNEKPLLDLCYIEDSSAEVDMNIVMTGSGQFVEVQGTGEEYTFSKEELAEMLALGEKGCQELIVKQKEILGKIAERVGK